MLIEEIRKNAGFLNENYENLSVDEIYEKGTEDPNFDFNKGFDALISKDKTGEWIYYAGMNWKTFDFKKGFNALLEKAKTGRYICFAGRDWKTFDFKKGFDALLEKEKDEGDGRWIYYAGNYYVGSHWKEFDFNKGFKALEKIGGQYLEKAKKRWPKTYTEKLKDVKDKYDENHIPSKRRKLKR